MTRLKQLRHKALRNPTLLQSITHKNLDDEIETTINGKGCAGFWQSITHKNLDDEIETRVSDIEGLVGSPRSPTRISMTRLKLQMKKVVMIIKQTITHKNLDDEIETISSAISDILSSIAITHKNLDDEIETHHTAGSIIGMACSITHKNLDDEIETSHGIPRRY